MMPEEMWEYLTPLEHSAAKLKAYLRAEGYDTPAPGLDRDMMHSVTTLAWAMEFSKWHKYHQAWSTKPNPQDDKDYWTFKLTTSRMWLHTVISNSFPPTRPTFSVRGPNRAREESTAALVLTPPNTRKYQLGLLANCGRSRVSFDWGVWQILFHICRLQDLADQRVAEWLASV